MQPLYPTSAKCLIPFFDLLCPGTEQLLRCELAGWRDSAHAERLLGGFTVLMMRPGGAGR
jgi:hypothetical protein